MGCMTRVAYLAVIVLALGLGGCAVVQGALDWVFGVSEEGQDSDNPASVVGGILGTFVPWAGAAVTLAGGLYANLRRKHWVSVLGTVAKGINEARAQKDENGKIDASKLVEILAKEQDKAGVRDDVRKIVHQVEAK